MDPFSLPPDFDCAPEFCFCGRKTVESHEFWFCSIDCARQDALRSLDNPECHYRNVVRDAYFRASPPKPQLRRMASTVHLRPGLPELRDLKNPPPFIPPANVYPTSPNRIPQDWSETRFPTLSQVTGKVLTKKVAAGEFVVPERQDRPRWKDTPDTLSRARAVQVSGDHTFEQISHNAVPLPEHVPSTIGSITRKASVAALVNFGKSRKGKEGEKPERVLGHEVNPIIPPVRKESLPSHRQTNTSPQTSKALRRSASFAGWNASGTSHGRDTVMQIIDEMREELCESFDPRTMFQEEKEG